MKQHHRMALGYCITILGGVCWAIGGACGQTLFEQNSITSDWVVPIRLLLAALQGEEKALEVGRSIQMKL